MGKFKENKERTLTQDEFIRRLSSSMGISYEQAKENVSNVKTELVACMLDGLCVKWRGFGTLGAFEQKGRNIFTKKKTETEDKFIVKFRVSKYLNNLVNYVMKESF